MKEYRFWYGSTHTLGIAVNGSGNQAYNSQYGSRNDVERILNDDKKS